LKLEEQMANVLVQRLRPLSGRAEIGQWIQATVADPKTGAVELEEFLNSGGRFNPPGSFPVAYLAKITDGGRETLCRYIVDETNVDSKFVILILEVNLAKVLDLTEASVRKSVGISLADLTKTENYTLSQSIGKAAHDAGFGGIVYPRAQGKGARNLAVFCDRTGTQEISIVGAGGLGA
jgi:RES domain-containing protein